MFATCRQIGAYAAENLSAAHGAKTARYFLLHFGHANIALPPIIGERNGSIFHEAQDIVLVIAKTLQKVA